MLVSHHAGSKLEAAMNGIRKETEAEGKAWVW